MMSEKKKKCKGSKVFRDFLFFYKRPDGKYFKVEEMSDGTVREEIVTEGQMFLEDEAFVQLENLKTRLEQYKKKWKRKIKKEEKEWQN